MRYASLAIFQRSIRESTRGRCFDALLAAYCLLIIQKNTNIFDILK